MYIVVLFGEDKDGVQSCNAIAACALNGIGKRACGRAVPGMASRFRGSEQDDPILDLTVDSTWLAASGIYTHVIARIELRSSNIHAARYLSKDKRNQTSLLCYASKRYTPTTVETVPSRAVEVHLFRWGPIFSEGVHLFQPFNPLAAEFFFNLLALKEYFPSWNHV